MNQPERADTILKQVTIIGMVWGDGPTPMLSWCHAKMPVSPRSEGMDDARTTLMQEVAERKQLPVAELEVHDVLVLPGHLKELAFEPEPRRRRR